MEEHVMCIEGVVLWQSPLYIFQCYVKMSVWRKILNWLKFLKKAESLLKITDLKCGSQLNL
jgi:hypothetical protein